MADQDLAPVDVTDASPDVSSAANGINLPDSPIRQAYVWQAYVRLARPTLDWFTAFAVLWVLILQPLIQHKFDPIAATLSLTWAAAVYGFKFAEAVKGVA